ncbi:FkbM family methyltransferase [Brevundimonas sp. GN22]
MINYFAADQPAKARFGPSFRGASNAEFSEVHDEFQAALARLKITNASFQCIIRNQNMNAPIHDFNVGDRTFRVATDEADTLIGYTLANEKTWEPWQLEIYRRLLNPNSVCYDIGANIGTSALAMAHYGGQVFAFEPVTNTHRILVENVARNGVENITTVNAGISNADGEAKIIVDRAMLGNAHQIKGHQELGDTQYIDTMALRSLDSWRAETGAAKPDLIKIDVEGYEIEVLEGGSELFYDPNLIVIVEFAIVPQRTAWEGYFPDEPKDVAFFRELRKRFRHIFLIGRDQKLFRIRSYAELRVLMMRGYPVDDLLCCQIVPDSLADLIEVGPVLPGWLGSKSIVSNDGLLLTLNQDDDGWALKLGSELGGCSAIIAYTERPMTIKLKFSPIHIESTGVPIRPVMIVNGDQISFTDTIASIHLSKGVNWILLEAQNAFDAGQYFGNPNDTRQIAFKYAIEV